jgi:hypothetical protein
VVDHPLAQAQLLHHKHPAGTVDSDDVAPRRVVVDPGVGAPLLVHVDPVDTLDLGKCARGVSPAQRWHGGRPLNLVVRGVGRFDSLEWLDVAWGAHYHQSWLGPRLPSLLPTVTSRRNTANC